MIQSGGRPAFSIRQAEMRRLSSAFKMVRVRLGPPLAPWWRFRLFPPGRLARITDPSHPATPYHRNGGGASQERTES